MSHGGARDGAGRPTLGLTKKVSVTLDESIWHEIEYIAKNFDMSKSEIFRFLVENGLDHLVNHLHQKYVVKENHVRNEVV